MAKITQNPGTADAVAEGAAQDSQAKPKRAAKPKADTAASSSSPPAPKALPTKAAPRPMARSGGATVTNEVPQLGGRPRGVEPPPRGEVLPPFFITCHANRWCVMGGRIVPMTRRLKCTPGSNGVDRDQAGNPVMGLALAQAEEQGWTAIPWEVDGPGTSYLRRVKSTGGWIDRWTTVYSGSADETFDEVGFATWLDSLIERGVIKPPPLYALYALHERQLKIMGRLQEKVKTDHRSARLESMRRDLELLERTIASITSPGTSEPAVEADTAEAVPQVAGV